MSFILNKLELNVIVVLIILSIAGCSGTSLKDRAGQWIVYTDFGELILSLDESGTKILLMEYEIGCRTKDGSFLERSAGPISLNYSISENNGKFYVQLDEDFKLDGEFHPDNKTLTGSWQVFGCNSDFEVVRGTESDFASVKIGNQTWMKENLNLPVRKSWCYDLDQENCVRYGRLYTYEAARKRCPEGWHIPTKEEWEELINYLGGEKVAGSKLLMGGSSGFEAPLSGIRTGIFALKFSGKEERCCFWSSTDYQERPANSWYIELFADSACVQFDYCSKNIDGLSVRYIKEK